MGRVDTPKSGAPIGCPSGLQTREVAELDPMGGALDLSPYVTRSDNEGSTLELIVQGAHCAGCLAKIERAVTALVGVKTARMNLSTLRLRVVWDGDQTSANDIVKALSDNGFGAAPYSVDASEQKAQDELKYLLRAIAVAGFAAMNVMLLSIAVWSGGADMGEGTHSLFHWISALIALPTVAYAGRPFFRSAFAALAQRRTNMDVPISLALVLACGLSLYETVHNNLDTYFDAAVMLLFLLLIGRYLDARLRQRTGAAARRLAAMQVTSATRILPDGSIETVPAASIKPGDTLLIPAGQRLPVDGIIARGTSDFDMHIATGESQPQCYGPGDPVYSGTINLTAPLTITASAALSDSFLSEITELVELGEQSKSRFVKIADRAARAYVPVVHTLALLTFVGWLLVGADLRVASLNAIAVLIITCPCALGLAVPAVQIVAAGRLFKNGVLIRSGDALERLAKTKSVIFDKTGTLTQGRPILTNTDDIAPDALALAAALARQSNHPVSRALHGMQTDLEVTDITEIPGQGLRGTFAGDVVRFGSAKFLGLDSGDARAGTVWLQKGTEAPVAFAFVDALRPDAADVVAALQADGLRVDLLSGDVKSVAETTAKTLGIEHWYGQVSPRQKMNVLYQREAEGRYPLMVGDGINDAPALAAANSSASLASAADVAMSASDIILQGDRLSGLPMAIKTARAARSRVIENLGLAITYNMIAIPLAVFGFVNPLIAALAMSGSSLLVTLNALRMAR